ncbi:hypothetical protein Q9966_003083 [Columba livia]|nr:hypothetical protein Q9966_003083 [Columba livia]
MLLGYVMFLTRNSWAWRGGGHRKHMRPRHERISPSKPSPSSNAALQYIWVQLDPSYLSLPIRITAQGTFLHFLYMKRQILVLGYATWPMEVSQFTLWNGELFRKTLPGFNSVEATGAQHGQDQAFLAWVRMKPLQPLWGWWAEDGQSKKLLVISQMMLPRGGWVWKGLITEHSLDGAVVSPSGRRWWLEGDGDEKRERESSGVASSSPLLPAVDEEQTLGSGKCCCVWKYSKKRAGWGDHLPIHKPVSSNFKRELTEQIGKLPILRLQSQVQSQPEEPRPPPAHYEAIDRLRLKDTCLCLLVRVPSACWIVCTVDEHNGDGEGEMSLKLFIGGWRKERADGPAKESYQVSLHQDRANTSAASQTFYGLGDKGEDVDKGRQMHEVQVTD